MENAVFKNAEYLKVKEALILIQTAHHYGTPELIELLDKIIGNNLYDVPSGMLVNTLESFMMSAHSRPKIYEALMKRVGDVAGELPMDDLCTLSSHLTNFNGGFDHMYEIIEPYIMNRINVMTENDLLSCV